MFELSLAFSALALTAHASPALPNILSRQSLCANNTEIQDFTLAATDPSTGASQPVAVDFTAVLATTSSMTGAPFNSNFTLTDTFLFTGAFPTAQLGGEATAGDPITFEAFSLGVPPPRPFGTYCSVAVSPPLLGFNVDATDFSLCQSSTSQLEVIVFQAEEGSSLYNFGTCVVIDLSIEE